MQTTKLPSSDLSLSDEEEWEVVLETESNSDEEVVVSISTTEDKKEDSTNAIEASSPPSPPPSDLKLSEEHSAEDDSTVNSQVEDAHDIFEAGGDIPQLSDNNGDGIGINGKVIGNIVKDVGEISNNVIDATTKLCEKHRVKERSKVAAENVGNALIVVGSYTIDATEKAKKAYVDYNIEQKAVTALQGARQNLSRTVEGMRDFEEKHNVTEAISMAGIAVGASSFATGHFGRGLVAMGVSGVASTAGILLRRDTFGECGGKKSNGMQYFD